MGGWVELKWVAGWKRRREVGDWVELRREVGIAGWRRMEVGGWV